MSLRGAALEFRMPAAHRGVVHAGRAQHFDPELLVYRCEPFAGTGSAQHSCQQSLLILEINNALGRLTHPLFQQPGPGFAAGGQYQADFL